MNRTFTALALSTLFAAAPAFARKQVDKPVAGDTAKAPAGETKPAEGAKSDTAGTTTTGEASKTEKSTKKSSKKSAKKAESKTEGAPAEGAPAK